MAILNTRLTDTSPTTVFQSSGQQVISVMYFCNTSNNTVSLNVFAVNNDDSTGASEDNIIYQNLELTGYETYVVSTEKLVLDNLDEIEIEANVANVVTITVSYVSV